MSKRTEELGLRDTHIVIKRSDIKKYLKDEIDIKNLCLTIDKLNLAKMDAGAKSNSYIVVNLDEPYADELVALMKQREAEKN